MIALNRKRARHHNAMECSFIFKYRKKLRLMNLLYNKIKLIVAHDHGKEP